MLRLFNSKVRSGYIIAFLLLLISYILIFYTIKKLVKEANSVSHTYSVINKLETMKAEVFDVETGLRGYVITQDLRFLQPYHSGMRNIPIVTRELKILISDNPEQVKDLDTLNRLITWKLQNMSDGLALFQTNGFRITEEMKATREYSKNVTDSVRSVIQEMKEREESMMLKRKTKLSQFFTGSNIITIVSLVIAIVAIFFSWFTYNHENKAKVEADQKTMQYRDELEKNIRELKKANKELQELKSIEKFAATGRIARTIAHEVRNPLTNISLAGEQLQEMAKNNPDSSMLLDMVSRNANRINQLVSDLLNATRVGQLEFSESDINQLLEETLELAKDRIELNHIKVEKKYAADLSKVLIDADKMQLAMLNIIVNAIEAMEKNKGILGLTTRKEGNKCIIEIRDNGTGMDEDTLLKLFEPYFTAKPKGNGLGLTNSQNIILNHGGQLNVYSKPGQGSTFVIILNELADRK